MSEVLPLAEAPGREAQIPHGEGGSPAGPAYQPPHQSAKYMGEAVLDLPAQTSHPLNIAK